MPLPANMCFSKFIGEEGRRGICRKDPFECSKTWKHNWCGWVEQNTKGLLTGFIKEDDSEHSVHRDM